MKKSTWLGVVTAVSVLAAVSCKKDKNTTPATVNPPGKDTTEAPVYMNADGFYGLYRVPLQEFSGDAGAGFTITGSKGTEIYFPAGAFVDADGQEISGNVTVRIREVVTKRDILFSGITTEASGALLESGGQLYVEAESGGRQLKLNPARRFPAADAARVRFPKDPEQDPAGMVLFTLQQNTATGGNNFTWLQVQRMVIDFGETYNFPLPDLNWINIDRFVNDPRPKTDVHVTIGGSGVMQDVAVSLVFRDINSMVSLAYSETSGKFTSDYGHYGNLLPEGAACTILVFAHDAAGKLMMDAQPVTITADGNYTVTPRLMTEEEAAALVADL